MRQRTLSLVAAVFVFAVGVLGLSTNLRLGTILRFGSYDWAHDLALFCSKMHMTREVEIIYLDEPSHQFFNQPLNAPWDRGLHAKLLDRLTEDGAKAVIFDIVFSDPGSDPAADAAFADAIKRNGRVILAADLVESEAQVNSDSTARESSLTLPFKAFTEAGARWGLSQLQPDEDFMVREHRHVIGEVELDSLAWTAGLVTDVQVTREVGARGRERWLNYADGPKTIPSLSYQIAFSKPAGYFKKKVVFIGGRPTTGLLRERRDEFRSPYTSWFRDPVFLPAVDVHATMYVNLLDEDWLSRPSPIVEWLILIAGALYFGFYLTRFSPVAALWRASLGVVVTTGIVLALFVWARIWFPWLILIGLQIPAGGLCVIVFRSIEWRLQKKDFEAARKKDEARIREQAALLDKAQDAIMVHTVDGVITYWNPGAAKLYGWTVDDFETANMAEVLFAGASSSYDESLKATIEKGEWVGLLHQTTKTGQKIIVESRWTRVCDEAGTASSILVINTDVTERKKLESHLWRAQRIESVGTLASGLAHDLNNVLTPVLMGAQLLQRKPRDERELRMLQTIEVSAQRGSGMARQLLTFVRGYEGQMVVLQLKHILREVAKIVEDTFPGNIKMLLDLPSDLMPVKGDATQLHQVFLNLCVNARDAMPNGGQIQIEARNCRMSKADPETNRARLGNFVICKVSDTGEGIPPKVMDRIFEPFFTTKAVGKGTGLGLSTALGIVKSHGGTMDVVSEVSKGTVFSVCFPVADVDAPVSVAPGKIEDVSGAGELVLVVESDPLVRGVVEFVLEQHSYQVVQAKGPQAGLEVLQQHGSKLAIVIVDGILLASDGGFMECLNQHRDTLQVMVLVEGAQTFDGFTTLRKPFTAEDLLKTVSKVRRRGLGGIDI